MESLKAAGSAVVYGLLMAIYYAMTLIGVGIFGFSLAWASDRLFGTRLVPMLQTWLKYQARPREPKPQVQAQQPVPQVSPESSTPQAQRQPEAPATKAPVPTAPKGAPETWSTSANA